MSLTILDGIVMNDGHRLPRMGFGTFQLAEDEVRTAIDAALSAGFRLIDCARFYGNEAFVGDALAEADIARDDLFITSKVWNDRQIDGTVRESVEETLRDLRVDHLDLLLIHWPVAEHYVDTWKTFIALRDEGIARSIGVSNHTQAHIEALVKATGVVPAVDQLERHPHLNDGDMLRFCKEHDIVFEAWSPLGRGECLDDATIGAIARAHDASPAQIVLAWQLAGGVVPIPRSKNPDRIQSNAAAAGIELSSEEIARIDALNSGSRVTEGIDPEHFAEQLNSLSSHF